MKFMDQLCSVWKRFFKIRPDNLNIIFSLWWEITIAFLVQFFLLCLLWSVYVYLEKKSLHNLLPIYSADWYLYEQWNVKREKCWLLFSKYDNLFGILYWNNKSNWNFVAFVIESLQYYWWQSTDSLKLSIFVSLEYLNVIVEIDLQLSVTTKCDSACLPDGSYFCRCVLFLIHMQY